MKVGAVLLAAGGSKRLGTPKQLLCLDGETLIHRAARALTESAAHSAVAVIGAHSATCRAELRNLSVTVVHNPQWEQGIASSLISGLDAIRQVLPNLDAVIFAVCDQPALTSKVINALIERFSSDQPDIVASDYGSAKGVPALFGQRLFNDLSALHGDQGAKGLFTQYASSLVSIPFPGGDIDIDSPEDSRALN